MNTEIDRIRDQLRRAILGNAWHGPSVNDSMDPFDATTAWVRMPPSGHSACEIVLHITSWLEIVKERLEGRSVSPSMERDWPPAGEADQAFWEAAVERLRTAYSHVDRALASMTDADLQRTAPGKDYTLYFMAHGVIQHSLYHAGQLVLFSRLLADGPSHRSHA